MKKCEVDESDKLLIREFDFIIMNFLVVLSMILIGNCYGWGNFPAKNLFSRSIVGRTIASASLSFGIIITGDYIMKSSLHSNVAIADDKTSTSVFVGNYNDPNHPGCFRKIVVKGKDVSIIGSDNLDGSKQFIIKAKEDYPGTIFVDFSPKGFKLIATD